MNTEENNKIIRNKTFKTKIRFLFLYDNLFICLFTNCVQSNFQHNPDFILYKATINIAFGVTR